MIIRIVREWVVRLAASLRTDRRDHDLAEELKLHIEMVEEEARRRDSDPEEALRIARLQAGGSAQAIEAMRDQRGLPWLEDLGRDLQYGLRTLRRRPGFASIAIVSLALGIGANTGIFSLFDQALLRVLPVKDPERLVMLNWRGPSLPRTEYGTGNLMSYPLCLDLQEQTRFFDAVFCRSSANVNFSTGQEYRAVKAELVSGSYFAGLGVHAELGRLIGESDNLQPGQHPVVVLSHHHWKAALGGAHDVIGRRVFVNNHSMTVIGVAAPEYRGVDVAQPVTLWIPAMMAHEATLEFSRVRDRRAMWMHVFARLKPGVTIAQARAGLQPWFSAMLSADTRREDFPPASPDNLRAFLASSVDVLPASRGWSSLRSTLEQPLWLLFAGTALLLALACLNVANLLLARGAERGQELAMRLALGASRGRITRQLIVETLLIALVGGMVGLAAAPAVSHMLLAFLPDNTNLTPALDARIFLYALSASVIAGVVCGLAPALQAGRRPPASAVTGRSTASGDSVRVRKIIVGAQLALTLVLLAGAGLFTQTLHTLYSKDYGFDRELVVLFGLDPGGTGYTPPDAARVMRDVLQSLRGTSNIEHAAIANNSMLSSLGPSRMITIALDRERIVLDHPVPMMRVSPGFFTTLGASIIAGREFDTRDTRGVEETGPRSIIVNDTFARRYFGRRSAIGQRVGFGNQPDAETDIEIIGVVSDFTRRFVRDERDKEHIFVPFAESGELAGDGVFYVRVRGEAESTFASIRAAVAKVDPRLPLLELKTLADQLAQAVTLERMLAALSIGFATVALLLSVVGVFGVMWYVVTQRTQEIGMRMALGATHLMAVWLVVRDALMTIGVAAAVGIAVGAAVIAMASSWLTDVLYGVSSSDIALTFAAAATGLTAFALAACVIPAERAAMLSPMVAIREQPESMWHSAGLRVRNAIRELATVSRGPVDRGTIMSDVATAVHRAATFPDALTVAIDTLRERVGARSVLLLEKRARGEYQCRELMIPAGGVLMNRLSRYPHPLPLTRHDFDVWERWAGQCQPSHVLEIQRLARTGVRMAVPLRNKHEMIGLLLLAPEASVSPDAESSRSDQFTHSEKELLEDAAGVFALLVENVRLNERALEQERLRRDLALAAEVQRRLLPAHPPKCAAAALAAFTQPARSVGGDYYDFIELHGGRIGIALADVAGKGIPAALLMSAVHASLRVMVGQPGLAGSQLAVQMNRFLHQATATNSYVTFFYAQLDPQTRRLQYVNAGHNPPYVLRGAGTDVRLMELRTGGTVLGLFPEIQCEDGVIDLCAGDLIVAYTDGVTEAQNAQGEEFGEERLKQFLREGVGGSADATSEGLAAQIREWIAGVEQYDDVTFVVAKVR